MRGVTFSEALAVAEYPPSTPIHAILKTTRVDRAGTAPMSVEEERLVFVNLEENLMHNLRDAFECAARCPQLLILRLGKNKFAPLPGPTAPPLPLLERLNTLTLTACGLTSWQKQVACLAASLPQLQELSLGGNPDLLQDTLTSSFSSGSVDGMSGKLDAVKLDDNENLNSGQSPVLFPKLKVLEMTKCGISKWAQVC